MFDKWKIYDLHSYISYSNKLIINNKQLFINTRKSKKFT